MCTQIDKIRMMIKVCCGREQNRNIMFFFLILCLSSNSILQVKAGIFNRAFVSGNIIHTIKNLQTSPDNLSIRGGDQEATLDEKVHEAMLKLGLNPPPLEPEAPVSAEAQCDDGACAIPPPPPPIQRIDGTAPEVRGVGEEEAEKVAKLISSDLNVDLSLSWAALGATATTLGDNGSRRYHEDAAREMIQQELQMIEKIPEDSSEVKQLVSEGYSTFLSRRALAFAENDLDNARAILLADEADEEEEQKEKSKASVPIPPPPPPTMEEKNESPEMRTLKVDKNFDPTSFGTQAPAPNPKPTPPSGGAIKPAKKSDVVFEATAGKIQELVLESPVPVLLDVYADWCGPCKVLGPALEEMAVKSGGAFRLVKLNTDNERSVSGALEVQSLPTVFGIKDGKILNMFVGMPRSEDAMKNFMMGLLIPGAKFEPPVTAEEATKFKDLSGKLVKVAAASSYSFAARERLNDRIVAKLDELVDESGSVIDADASASVIRSLLSNVLRDPYNEKFRVVNLENKVIAAKIAKYSSCLAILRSVGFIPDPDGTKMTLGQGKRVVNVAPLTVARDSISKWIDKRRYEVAKASRKRKDELDRIEVQKELQARKADEAEDEIEVEVDPDACNLQIRVDGKKKVHDISMHADDKLEDILDQLSVVFEEGGQITCVAKKLVVKSSDKETLGKSLRDLGLSPKAALVVTIGDKTPRPKASKLADRAAEKMKKKTGSHTMQSVGIYSKDDNAKGELIDGGGGVWYEQDVTDDEDEGEQEEKEGESPVDQDDATAEGDEDPGADYEYEDYSEAE